MLRREVLGQVTTIALGLWLGSRHAVLAASEEASAGSTELADKIVVVKGERRLYLVRGGQVLKSYRVALGHEPKGTKLHQGDGRTPEGLYRVSGFNAASRFFRSIRISYPNEEDVRRARALGQPAGGDIMIHGLAPERRSYGAEHWRFNWTNGCIAVTDAEIDEIWRRVEVGTPIEIRP